MKSHLQSPKNVAPSLPWHLHIPSSFVCSSQWISLCKHGASILQKISNRNHGSHQLPLISTIDTPKFIYQPYHKVLFRQKKMLMIKISIPTFFKQSNKNSSPQPKRQTHISPVQKIASLQKQTLETTANPRCNTTTHTSHHQPG